eukprot:gene24659-10285_t
MEEEDGIQVDCYRDKEGSVMVELQTVPIVQIRPNGEIKLSTGGYWDDDTVCGMHKALSSIGFKIVYQGDPGNCPIVYQGDPADGRWSLLEGAKLHAFEDLLVIGANGARTASRARAVLAKLNPKEAQALPQRRPNPNTAKAAAQPLPATANTAQVTALRGLPQMGIAAGQAGGEVAWGAGAGVVAKGGYGPARYGR